MRKVLLNLHSDNKSIEYSMDLESSKFEVNLIDLDGSSTKTQDGDIGATDAERQDLALRMYHIILAALRAPKY